MKIKVIEKSGHFFKVAFALSFVALASPANASFLHFVPHASIYSLMATSSASSCQIITYDANGNRVVVQAAPIASGGMTWGGGVFGCSTWGV